MEEHELVQTFLPDPDFNLSAKLLDWQRLNKQRVEAWMILCLLFGWTTSRRWATHPAIRMWDGHECFLALYGQAMCKEWERRGYEDNMLDGFIAVASTKGVSNLVPNWIFDERIHVSHQANLVRKNPEFYTPRFPGVKPEEGYLWPVKQACSYCNGTLSHRGGCLSKVKLPRYELVRKGGGFSQNAQTVLIDAAVSEAR